MLKKYLQNLESLNNLTSKFKQINFQIIFWFWFFRIK
jgi:hypothetical protein